jgi:hypothetical protein
MNKEKIKETLIGIQQGKVKELTERVGVELLMLYKTQLEKSKNELKFLQRVDCGPHDSIQPGSIVETNQFNFFIGHTFPPINLEKGRLIGISLDSPFYEVLKTKKAGESFEFNTHNYTIISIN